MTKFMNYGKQLISENDIKFVVKALKSDFLTQGPIGKQFEEAFSEKVSADHSVAFNSATSALHGACAALDVGPEDHVWTSTISFVASANCALYCGAVVDFVDIDPKNFNLSSSSLEKKLKVAQTFGKLPKVVIAVHMCGQSCDMKEIHRLSKIYGFRIIEDASHATGSSYRNKKVGCCEYSDITVFSFHPVKIITTGEGGMATSNCKALEKKLRLFRSHGVTRETQNFTNLNSQHPPWYYEQQSLGYNYRLSDIQSALGLSQLHALDSFVNQRNDIASLYNQKLSNFTRIKTPFIENYNLSSFHLYVIRVDFYNIAEKIKLFQHFKNQMINLNVHYIPIHTQPYFRDLGFKEGDFPNSEKYYEQALSLPIYPGIEDRDIHKVTKVLEEFIG